jgi:hypothetical protein
LAGINKGIGQRIELRRPTNPLFVGQNTAIYQIMLDGMVIGTAACVAMVIGDY